MPLLVEHSLFFFSHFGFQYSKASFQLVERSESYLKSIVLRRQFLHSFNQEGNAVCVIHTEKQRFTINITRTVFASIRRLLHTHLIAEYIITLECFLRN